jgi:hypothetical protein
VAEEDIEDDLAIDGFVDCTAILNCAIYALVRKGRVVYVGQSRSAHARISTHCRMRRKRAPREGAKNSIAGIAFDEIWVRQCTLGQLDILEAAMIKKHQPKHNKIYQPPLPPIPLEELFRLVPTLPTPEAPPVAASAPVYRRF